MQQAALLIQLDEVRGQNPTNKSFYLWINAALRNFLHTLIREAIYSLKPHAVLYRKQIPPKQTLSTFLNCVWVKIHRLHSETQDGRRNTATGMRWIIHVATQGASKWLMSLRKTFKSSHTLRCVFSLSSRCQLLIPSSRLPSFHLHYRKQTHKYYRHASHNTATQTPAHTHTQLTNRGYCDDGHQS